MDILVLGNGFDLAHGLPTGYINFLEFCERVMPIYKEEGKPVINYYTEVLEGWEINNEIKDYLDEAFKSRKRNSKMEYQTKYPGLDELFSLIDNNIWFYYFIQCDRHGKENWVDFESEISNVIKSITEAMEKYNISLYKTVYNFRDGNSYELPIKYEIILDIIEECKEIKLLGNVTYLEIKDYLLDDLNRLTRALEIYLTEVIGKVKIEKMSSDIIDIVSPSIKVLNFNYTNTYIKEYYYNEINIDYIHGKARKDNTVEDNNMVLGIDEYLPEDRRNKDTEFINFKKYYQRIYKGTGCKYKEWVSVIHEDFQEYKMELERINMYKDNIFPMKQRAKEIKNNYLNKHNLYIFGHSLDITDKDILRDLILNDNVHTTIFYHSKEELGRKIANLVKVIGQDELIKRTSGGNRPVMEFVPQSDMKIKAEIS